MKEENHDIKLENDISARLFEDSNIEKASEKQKKRGKPRLEKPVREQVEMQMRSLDDLIPDDHPVRVIWQFVEKLDFDIFHADIKSIEGDVGRTAKDRRILFALWLFAYTEGIGSARRIAKLTKRDDVYRWIVGGVNVNYHTIADFRSENEEKLDELFIQCLAVIMKDLNIEVKRIGNDGTKIRAKAKRDTFHKEENIQSHLDAAKEHLEEVKKQNEENLDLDKRIAAARLRAAREKVEKCEKALETLKEIQKDKRPSEKEKVKVSITEPESKVMKFGGSSAYHPAYNIQCAEDLDTNIIVAIEPTQDHNDSNGLLNVMPKVEENLGQLPPEAATDKGYANYNQLDYMDKLGVDFYTPEAKESKSQKSPGFLKENSNLNTDEKKLTCPNGQVFDINKRKASSDGSLEFRFNRKADICGNCHLDTECFPEQNGKKKKEICYTVPTERHQQLLEQLKERTSTDFGKETLKLRFAAELVHARIKTSFGLTQFHVQTLERVRAELLLVAIVHNFKRWAALRRGG